MASAKSETIYAPLETSVSADEVQVAEVIEIPSVQVQAPSDLPEGYQLSVEIKGKANVVAVPVGGVQRGQSFQATIVSQENANGSGAEHNAPVGAWRDGICDCCEYGACHPSCCISCWCTFISLGQVMTRMRLDWTGDPDGYRPGGLSPFKVMVMVTVVYFTVHVLVDAVTQPFTTTPTEYGTTPVTPGWVALLIGLRAIVGLCCFLYVLIARIRTRGFIRNKYAIPEQCCSGCEDCCVSFWCDCCTTAQMLRHTADYRTDNADCCSETGLSQEAWLRHTADYRADNGDCCRETSLSQVARHVV